MKGQRFSYFTLSRAVRLHEMLIKVSGGLPGHCPERLMMLESTLELIQNDCYYPSFFDKAAHLDTSKNLQPQLAGRKIVFENRRIPSVFEDRRKRFDAPDDEDRGF